MAPKRSQWARLEALEQSLRGNDFEILNPRSWDGPTPAGDARNSASIAKARSAGHQIIVIKPLRGTLDRMADA